VSGLELGFLVGMVRGYEQEPRANTEGNGHIESRNTNTAYYSMSIYNIYRSST
jgi:hypothetical protein